MVWRILFTAEDLERIQVRPTLGPLAETVKWIRQTMTFRVAH